MKLSELIVQLQGIEKSVPQTDVFFQFADVDVGGRITRSAIFYDAVLENGTCVITIGDREVGATLFKEQSEILKHQG